MMITTSSQDSLHKAWLYRLLISIVDNDKLQNLYFKGGTCAAMLGMLDRFSVDLDFDFVGEKKEVVKIKNELKNIFLLLGLEIKDESKQVPQFFLKYKNKDNERNTLKIDVTFPPPENNTYEPKFLPDINRTVMCQDIRTMFANKLVAVIDRYEKNGSIAGRDIYDIHHFFLNGYKYNENVIKERSGLGAIDFFKKLKKFITEKITNTILDQDLNQLLPYDKFKQIRKTLKDETLRLIEDEIKRLKED